MKEIQPFHRCIQRRMNSSSFAKKFRRTMWNAVCLRRFCSSSGFQHLFMKESCIPKYWEVELCNVNRGSAKSLISKLVSNNVLGFEGAVDKVRLGLKSAKDVSKLRVTDLACAWKRDNPEMVLLVRIGDFYESWGVDAVMLVQHAGLNPMGDSCRAGCPKGNIHQTLSALTDAGLSVAVYEEVNSVGTKSTRTKKERYLSQVVTPGRPVYLHDTCLREGEIVFGESKPYMGVRCTEDGCGVGFLSIDSKEMRVQEGLTEEALGSLIDSVGGVAEPVWVSADTSSRFARVKKLLPYRTKKVPISISFESMLTAVSTEVCKMLCLDADKFGAIKQIVSSSSSAGGMKPPHTGLAQFLGLAPNSTSPDLVRHILPPSAPFHAVFFMRNWLLCPPPEEVVSAMHAFVKCMQTTNSNVPHMRPVPVNKIVRLLETCNGNHHFFLDLHDLCESFLSVPADIFCDDSLGKIVAHTSGVSLSKDTLASHANHIEELISSTIHVGSTRPAEEEGKNGEILSIYTELERFFAAHESDFINCVRDCDGANFDSLQSAKSRLVNAIDRSLISVEKYLKYDQMTDKLYVRQPAIALKPNIKQQLIADDASKKRSSSDLMIKAEEEYRLAAEDSRKIAKVALQNLSKALISEPKFIQTLISISHLAVVVSSVALHVESSLRKGWVLPTPVSAADQGLELNQVWPYWLDPHPVGEAVQNDIKFFNPISAVSLLTAPNMSGKSTLIRSIAASVLLGNSGFMVPCTSANVPPFSDLLVVSPIGDRPAEGLSAFAAEAEAMAVALRHSNAKRPVLLLVDEFGRGTSGTDASALSAAVIEWLSNKSNVSCIWATHLHELFTLCHHLPVEWIQMDGFKLIPGKCRDSQGIATAREHGFPLEIIKHAFNLRGEDIHQTSPPLDDHPAEPACPVEKIYPSIKDHYQIIQVKPSASPPPSVQASPVVYILKFPNRTYYVGETENFQQRIREHRGKFGKLPERMWLFPLRDRSQARALETLLIRFFIKEGVQILSTSDAFHKSSRSALQ